MKLYRLQRVSLTMLWYLSFFYGYASLAEWVNPEVFNSVPSRLGFVFLGGLAFCSFLVISEGAGFRQHTFSQLIGEKDG